MMGDIGSKLKVGLVWAGSATHRRDRKRSIKLREFLPLGKVPSVHFFSLQKEPSPQPSPWVPLDVARGGHGEGELQMTDWTNELNDFADTAALVANLDLVISVDTAVAHLAGAMGKKVWVLVPAHTDWRWMLDREDSPWYPTARLFRQPSDGDWNSVIQKVFEVLKRL
jgi:hypothetical protein